MNIRSALIAVAVAVAGCGGSDRPAESPPSTTTTTSAQTTALAPYTPRAQETAGPHPIDMRYAAAPSGFAPTPMARVPDPQIDDRISSTIRRNVVGDKTLSFTAKGVFITTSAGEVTLRGHVQTEDEKRVIDAIARQTQGVRGVTDEIEVGP